MTDYPIRRVSHARRPPQRPMPYRGGRQHPLTIKNPEASNEPSGIQAPALTDPRAKRG